MKPADHALGRAGWLRLNRGRQIIRLQSRKGGGGTSMLASYTLIARRRMVVMVTHATSLVFFNQLLLYSIHGLGFPFRFDEGWKIPGRFHKPLPAFIICCDRIVSRPTCPATNRACAGLEISAASPAFFLLRFVSTTAAPSSLSQPHAQISLHG
jgi:hypothetical protein